MPNNPHASRNRSSSRHGAVKSAPPRAFDPVQPDIHDRLGSEPEREPAAPRGPDPPPRDARLRHQSPKPAHLRRLYRDHPAPRPLADQHLVATPRPAAPAPHPTRPPPWHATP